MRSLKMQITKLLKTILFYSGVYALIRKFKPNSKVAILRYHAIVDDHDNHYAHPTICLSKKKFEQHVKYFASRYTVLSLDQVIQALRTNTPLPKNAVAFTFDDGYADNLYAAKILKKYSATGTFYLTAACIDRQEPFWLSELIYYFLHSQKPSFELNLDSGEVVPFSFKQADNEKRWRMNEKVVGIIKGKNRALREKIRAQIRSELNDVNFQQVEKNIMLTWEQVAEMKNAGMTLGGHTMTHLNLPNAGQDDALLEIKECKALLEEKLDCQIAHFSYPNSGPYDYYTEEIRDLVESCGYLSSTTSYAGFAGPDSDHFALRRVRTVPSLVETVSGMEWDRIF